MSGRINLEVSDSFLDFYFERTAHNLELRALPSRKQLFTRDKSEAIKFIKQHERENLYYGAASRNGGGTAEHCREMPFLFADIDFKTFNGGEDKARARLEGFSLVPSIVVNSGGGLHCYWMLDKPIQNAYESREQLKAALLGIAQAVGGDPQVCEVARVMRLPGSLNHKYTPARLVRIEQWDTSAYYALDAFNVFASSHASINKNTNANSYRESVTDSGTLFMDGRRDHDLFHVANQLAKSGTSENEIAQIIDILAKNCIPPFPQEEIQAKILSAIKRQERREVGLTRALEGWVSVTNGNFSVTDAYQELQTITGVTDRNKYRVILNRLKDRCLIEKAGDKDGIFRRVVNECEEIDFLNASTDVFHIAWPFQIEKYVKTHPKNIIIIAGSPNSGKTAFLLNVVAMNMEHHRINYFSSEMGPIELKERLSKFNVRLADFKKVKWLERSGNFADVIRPNEVNVIDFLEMTTEFYQVAGFIKEIFDKINKGIAIIAIQKNPGVALGLGGVRSLEKARLYLSMDAGRIKIEKGKNWTRPDVNPNGLEIAFKLVQGCHFVSDDTWT